VEFEVLTASVEVVGSAWQAVAVKMAIRQVLNMAR
jgi:hypothetical protein